MVGSDPPRADRALDTPLAAKLETRVRLSAQDRDDLNSLYADIREIGARRSLIREGDRPDHVHLMVEGWAARHKILPHGARQITAFLIPGDFCDLNLALLDEMDHDVSTLTRSRIAFIPRARIDALIERPSLVQAFWRASLVDEALLRSWIVNVGRRDAYEAIGHLICELYVRMKNIGLVDGHRFDLPLTQEEIGDALGVTSVHVNRVLQRLRSEDVISLRQGLLTIHDARALEKASGFNSNYLHVERGRDRPAAPDGPPSS